MELFEQASRARLRFVTPKGALSVEDLWALPLQSTVGAANLDSLAMNLHAAVQADKTAVSFVNPSTSGPDRETMLAFEVVKRVIEVRVQERDAAAAAKKTAETKQKLMEIIDRKQSAALEGKSLEELQAELAKL